MYNGFPHSDWLYFLWHSINPGNCDTRRGGGEGGGIEVPFNYDILISTLTTIVC